MALSVLAVHAAAEDLLTCVCDGLALLPAEVAGLAGCPCRVFVTPGAAAADGCDGGCDVPAGTYAGQLTVGVARVYTTTYQDFPREQQVSDKTGVTVRGGPKCAQPPVTAVELIVTLFRCSPIPTDDGCPPTPTQLGLAAQQLHADMLAIERAILCCYQGTDENRRGGRRYVMGVSRPIGPQGGCVGVEQRVTVSLDDCVACPAAQV